jgi:hypothetical protein
VDDTEVGTYLARLRVDGVDLPRIRRAGPFPEFDPAHEVTIQ